MEFFAKGKRGNVFITPEKTVIKKAPETRILNEVSWLKKLNKHGIGPRLITYDKSSFEMELLEGDLIRDYIVKSPKDKCVKIVKDCLNQCRILDKLKVNKKEMHNPYKHIFVINNKARFIDFERCKITENPKNVTQFCQYLLSSNIRPILIKKGIIIDREKLIGLMKEYKQELTENKFKRISSSF